jgi:transposase InsO family protein
MRSPTARDHPGERAPPAQLHITGSWAEYVLCAALHNTYIPTWEGWLYLATVIDCHTKAVIGWATDDNYKTPLIEKAIEMAARNYPLAGNAIFHSDRGSNYTSCQFATTLKRHGGLCKTWLLIHPTNPRPDSYESSRHASSIRGNGFSDR